PRRVDSARGEERDPPLLRAQPGEIADGFSKAPPRRPSKRRSARTGASPRAPRLFDRHETLGAAVRIARGARDARAFPLGELGSRLASGGPGLPASLRRIAEQQQSGAARFSRWRATPPDRGQDGA